MNARSTLLKTILALFTAGLVAVPVTGEAAGPFKYVRVRRDQHVKSAQWNKDFRWRTRRLGAAMVKAGIIPEKDTHTVYSHTGKLTIGLGNRARSKKLLQERAREQGVNLRIYASKVGFSESEYDVEISGTNKRNVTRFREFMIRESSNPTTVPRRKAAELRRLSSALDAKPQQPAPKIKRSTTRYRRDPKARGDSQVAMDTFIGGRTENQDAFGQSINRHSGVLMLVGDGAGGVQGGKEAAWAATDTVSKSFRESSSTDPIAQLHEAFAAGNRTVLDAQQRGEKMGASTMTGAMIHNDGRLFTANLGDSRVYLSRQTKTGTKRRLNLLTKDHGFGDTITQYMGKKSIKPDVKEVGKLQAGDRVLICSDGLHKYISHAEIQREMGRTDISIAQVSKNLRALAAERVTIDGRETSRSQDNVTIQIYEHH